MNPAERLGLRLLLSYDVRMRTLALLLLVPATAFAESVWLTNLGPNKISVIKEVRTATGLGLKEAKDLVETKPPVLVKAGLTADAADALVMTLKGVGATSEKRADGAAATAPAATAPVIAPAEGKYSVRLESFGAAKIACIKVVKETLGLGLKEAKELVESAPVTVKQGTTKEAAEKFAAQLNEAGGTAKAILAGQ